ncbi:MAG: hypothetical protein PF541_03320 [Prolixibacteraceae bacterium]|jgi:Zn finger protein HypA/HybF involved in hydrogenase expression|nr:hypothetical protein [Prolixibacteraceae bacterium]
MLKTIIDMEKKYRCKDCNWVGSEEELEHEEVESCMGNDEIEICPKCGSMNVS